MRLCRSFLSAAILLGSSEAALAQTPSPAIRRAREVVAVINAATPASIRSFADTAFGGRFREFPAQAHIDFFMNQRALSGGLEWVEVQEEAADRATVLLRRKLTGDLVAVAVVAEAASPNKIVGLGQRPPRPSAAATVETRVARLEASSGEARADPRRDPPIRACEERAGVRAAADTERLRSL